MKPILITIFCFLILLASAGLAMAQREQVTDPCGDPAMESSMWGLVEGKVVKVEDGDTITISVKGRGLRRINLVGMEAPKRGNPFGEAAFRLLERLVNRRAVEVWVAMGFYWKLPREMSGVVFLTNMEMLDVNLLMIQSGLARHKQSEQYSMSTHIECQDRKSTRLNSSH